MPPLDPARTIRELEELRRLSGDERGAQRVAFTPTWSRARAWLRERFAGLPVEMHDDAAGNFWATLPGASERAVVVGGHIDSVPDGGWLDGCLDTLAGVEVMRRVAAESGGRPPVT
ncbi:MAG: Zn-dependent hydrolase, partial [Planctomycetia bacterium]|nr:Zn-dependent hydrolase [Planctomycetia bacterium]